jgi:hypothetical protein
MNAVAVLLVVGGIADLAISHLVAAWMKYQCEEFLYVK